MNCPHCHKPVFQVPKTKRQKQILDFIAGYSSLWGRTPSYREIADHLGLSAKSTIAKHVKALRAQGITS